MKTNFYVYVYLDCSRIPFYVGKGQGHRYKIWDHLGRSNPFLQSKIKKIGVEHIKIEFPLENVSEEDAFAYEELFIGIVGRRDLKTGPLCNLSMGGEGSSPSEETKRKISTSLKGKMIGRKNPNYGKPMSNAQKDQISNTLKGQSLSLATRKKISNTLKGRQGPMAGKKHTEETKQKISEGNKGRVAWNKGKKMLEETKKKISKANKGKQCWNKGKKLGPRPEEVKRKISEGHLRRRRS